MMTADVYDNTGADYDVTKVLSAAGNLDPEKFAAYSPPYLSATFAFVYGLSFASITAVIVHFYLWHGKEIYDAIRGRQLLDIHGRLMKAYKKGEDFVNMVECEISTNDIGQCLGGGT